MGTSSLLILFSRQRRLNTEPVDRRYHGPDDKRFPEGDWFCYPCRVVCSDGEALLNPAREAELMSTLETLGSLALFRRGKLHILRVCPDSHTLPCSHRSGMG